MCGPRVGGGVSPAYVPPGPPKPAGETPGASGTAAASGTKPATETADPEKKPETHGTSGTEKHEDHSFHPLFELSIGTSFGSHDLLGLKGGVEKHFGTGGHLELFGTSRLTLNHGNVGYGLGGGMHIDKVFGGGKSGFLLGGHAGAEYTGTFKHVEGGHAGFNFHGAAGAGYRFAGDKTKLDLLAGPGLQKHAGSHLAPTVDVSAKFEWNKKWGVEGGMSVPMAGEHAGTPGFNLSVIKKF